jgi:ATP-dependent RNA helicase DDX27
MELDENEEEKIHNEEEDFEDEEEDEDFEDEEEDFEDEEDDEEKKQKKNSNEKIEIQKFTDEEIAELEKERKIKREIKSDLKEEFEKKINKRKDNNKNKNVDNEDNDNENENEERYQDKFESEIYTKNMSFYDFNLSKLILRGCSDLEFFHPTKVQEKVIPLVLKNEDIFVNSETGSGKTACYLLPIIQKIITNKNSKTPIKALIILPTRELAFQCGEMLKSLIKYVDVSYNLICGGMAIEKQNLELKKELDIIIATPGRLIDMIYNYRSLSLEFINILVLDEADKLLEMGFKDSILEIISLMKNNENRQNLLFSATLNTKIVDLGKNTLKNPTKIKMTESAILKNLKQKIIRMTFKDLSENDFEKRLAYLIDLLRNKKRTIVFFNTKKECHKAYIFLEKFGLKSGELHADIDQTRRLKSLNEFQNGEIGYLLASDIAGRGIDIEKVKCVINFQMPLTQDRYTHRVGRTARKGYSGEAITICNDKDRQLIKKIMKKENFQLTALKINNSDIKGIYKIICENRNQVNLICEEEEAEKEMDRADKDVTKAFNMSNYKEEIMNKPRK